MLAFALQASLAGVFLYLLLRWLRQPNTQDYPLPPGPPAYPPVGHLGIMPQYNAERAFEKWGKEYGQSAPSLRF